MFLWCAALPFELTYSTLSCLSLNPLTPPCPAFPLPTGSGLVAKVLSNSCDPVDRSLPSSSVHGFL